MALLQSGSASSVLLIALAFAMVRLGFDPAVFDKLPDLLFAVCYPAMILRSAGDLLSTRGAAIVAFSLGSTSAILLAGHLALRRRPDSGRRETAVFCLAIGNLTFLGIPFVEPLFGGGWLGPAILFGAAQDLLIWTVCYWMFAHERALGAAVRSLFNPCFVCLVLGALLAAAGIQLPFALQNAVSLLADLTTPLALLCIGGILARCAPALRGTGRANWMLAAFRMVALPLVVLALLRLAGTDRTWALFCAFLTMLPAPILSVLFATRFEKDVGFATVNFVLTTLLYLALCVAFLLLRQHGVKLF